MDIKVPAFSLMTLFIMATITGCDSEVKISDYDLEYLDIVGVEKLAKQKKTVIVDVRKSVDYQKGHIPNAVNIFSPDIRRHDPRLTSARTIIVYGQSQGDFKVRHAAKKLLAMNYPNIRVFAGGIIDWTAAKKPLNKPLDKELIRPNR